MIGLSSVNHDVAAHLDSDGGTEIDERESGGVELFRKANAVLEQLQGGGEWTAQQLAESVGEPVSSTYRMIASLRDLGLVEKGLTRGGFRLGLYVMTLGAVCDDRISLRNVATPWLDWLRSETSATSFLMLRRGYNAVCIDRVSGMGVRSLALKLGGALPLYSGAGPRALLAFLPDVERREVLATFETRLNEDPELPSPRQLEHLIDRIREAGVSISDEDVTPGVAAVGAPVFNHRGELEAAVSVSTVRARLLGDREATVSRVLTAASEISRALGYQPSAMGGSK